MGDYMNNLTEKYKKSLGLLSINLDKELNISLSEASKKMSIAISNYGSYIKKKINPAGKLSSNKQIVENIKKIYFD